jgi:transcriptional regulator with XRE-family HTH domain
MTEETQVSDETPDERPELALGTRIRGFRQARKLTLRQVAHKAGVSESSLSQVERGASGVSISTLHTIAAALGLTVADLFDDTNNNAHRVVHPADRPMIQVPGVRKYMLTRQPLQSLEVLECDYEPGASTGGQGHSHGDSQELFIVLAGSLVVTIDGHAYEMTDGDSIEYRSSSSHAVTNVTDAHARGLFIISPPSL